VFEWDAATGRRLALSDGDAHWPGWLATAATRCDPALLEFVSGDDLDQFARDAATLRRWLRPISAAGATAV
jgi:hypothetical protein